MRRGRLLTLLGGFLLVGQLVLPGVAVGADAGSISGTVTDEGTGLPLAGVWVRPWGAAGTPPAVEVQTDADGEYSIAGLESGDYKVWFSDGLHVPEWWEDKPGFDSADPVSVTAGLDTSGIDAALAAGGWISGTVTDEGTGLPLADVFVLVHSSTGNALDVYGWSDSSGLYTVGGLPAGSYKVQFRDYDGGHGWEWWDDKPDLDSADLVTVTVGVDTPGINAALVAAGSISGTLTEEGTGLALADGVVSVYDSSGDCVGGGGTDPGGEYTVANLQSGDYKVVFSQGMHIPEWWNDKPASGSADLVSVTVGVDTSGIDAALAVGGWISGTVTEEGTGLPLADVAVSVHSPAGDWMGVVSWTDVNGAYSVGGLPAGDYAVIFSDGVHIDEWWDDQPGFGSADPVSVVVGVGTLGIDAALGLAGSISGTVTEEGTGIPLGDVVASVFDLAGDWVNSTSTDADGEYSVGGVPAGDYKVCFGYWDGAPLDTRGHLPECWDGKPDFDSADAISVVAGETTAGIDAALAVGGLISGMVTEEGTGTPLPVVYVMVYNLAGDRIGEGVSAWNGEYSIGALPAGDYKVTWGDGYGLHLSEWWDDKPDFDSADTVSVVVGETTGGIDAALAVAGPSIAELIDEFDTLVAAGDLMAVNGQGNLVAMSVKLTNVAKWLEEGRIDSACRALTQALERVDGLPKPEDWVAGPGAEELASNLEYLATLYGCGG